MKKVEINKDIRIKRDENYEVLRTIRNVVAQRINAEYHSEIGALENENQESFDAEKLFAANLKEFFKSISVTDTLKVVTQVGKGSTVLNTYVGHLEKPLGFNDKWFNFISPDRDNDSRPFTISFNCLQLIEKIEP